MTARVIRHKNLTRFDHPKKNTFGYFVRIQWKGEKVTDAKAVLTTGEAGVLKLDKTRAVRVG